MMSRTSKSQLLIVALAGLAMVLPVTEAAAYSVIYAPGYAAKRDSDVTFIYPRGSMPGAAIAADVAGDGSDVVVRHHVTSHCCLHVTVHLVERFYRPYIKVHRAASFDSSRARLHRAGSFGY